MYINEIVLCTMKSSQARMKSSAFASDEIKSASSITALAGFHRVAISSTAVGFLPPTADLVEKSTHYLGRQMCAFSGGDTAGIRLREYSYALRLTSELADLRAGM